MIKKITVLMIASMSMCGQAAMINPLTPKAQISDIHVTAQQRAKLKLLVGLVGSDQELARIAEVLKKDFEWSGQFDVTVQNFSKLSTKQEVAYLAHIGYPLVVFLTAGKNSESVEWRLYDTRWVAMLEGKPYRKIGSELRGWAHNVADEIWPALTGQEGLFSTKLAFCKDVENKRGHRKFKHVCIADYDGSHEQLLVTSPTINLVPRWNSDKRNPLLFYSESTDANIRLMSTSMKGQRKMASNFDGLNMCPAFSQDGTKVVYCASRGNGCCQLYYSGNGEFKKLIDNDGNNVSPTLSHDGSKMYYCSDFKTGKPQIYVYNFATGVSEQISESGSCFCPSYNQKKGQVAYCKIVSGYAQVFTYDEATKKNQQITFDATSKDECSWSPCGNYLVFALEKGKSSRIAMLNLITKERKFLTAEGSTYSYPTWSPKYEGFPTAAVHA